MIDEKDSPGDIGGGSLHIPVIPENYRKTENRDIIVCAVLAALTAVLFVASYSMPAAGAFLLFFTPLPLVIAGIRFNYSLSFSCLALSAFIIMLLSGVPFGVLYILNFGLYAYVTGIAIKKKYSYFFIILLGIFTVTLCMIAETLLFFWAGNELFNVFLGVLVSFKASLLKLLEHPAIKSQPDELKRMILDAAMKLEYLVPTILVSFALFTSVIYYAVTSLLLKRLNMDYVKPVPFQNWRFSEYFIWGFIVGFGGLMLFRDKGAYFSDIIFLNMANIFSIIFTIQGFAIFYFMFRKYNLNMFLTVLFFFLLFYSRLLPMAVGIIDVWMNFRKL